MSEPIPEYMVVRDSARTWHLRTDNFELARDEAERLAKMDLKPVYLLQVVASVAPREPVLEWKLMNETL